MRWAVLLPALLLGACHHVIPPPPPFPAPGAGPLDAQVPPYARDPYAPFSRAAAVAIARREWRAFRRLITYPDAPLPNEEREQGLWQRVGDYWWIGLDRRFTAQRWTGMHDANGQVFPAQDDGNYAWSAAFVSYVMRVSGAGDKFPYSENHADYINAAARHDPGIALAVARPQDYAPQPGDLICMWRGRRPVAVADLPTADKFPAHCDIVVAARPGMLDAIGGNVPDEVAMKHVPTAADGRLAGPDGVVVDTNYPWFVVLRVRYDDDAAPPSAISRARPPSIIASASQGSRRSAAR